MSVLVIIFLAFVCFAVTIINLIAYVFAFYSLKNRKTLTLGYSEMPATTLDLIIITLLPFIISGTFFVTVLEIKNKIML